LTLFFGSGDFVGWSFRFSSGSTGGSFGFGNALFAKFFGFSA